MSEVAAIVAVADNGVIGGDGRMLWHLPEDFQRLKRLTMGGHLVMGRTTYEAIGRPLPGRTNIVLTRDPQWSAEGVVVVHSLAEAFAAAEQADPQATTWVFGGAQVYRQAWDRITRLEVTEVHQAPQGDATFPAIDPDEFTETSRESHQGFDFVTYVRR